MAIRKEKGLVFLCVLLLFTSFFTYKSEEAVIIQKPHDLKHIFGPLGGYRLVASSPLDADIIRFLELDDYTQTRYQINDKIVDLYIGYYYSLDKVSAAHSPLSCFPGQGWAIGPPTKHKLTLDNTVINYEEFIASLGSRRELLMYWYQADQTTSQTPYINKINTVLNKFFKDKQEHAFVRVSVPIDNLKVETARNVGKEFIATFYPKFNEYINSTKL
jgi:EpsI family protein